ncbi:MAG: zf-HC2 domain-containing protein [Deltaproteobacteria bacterium]|nr:zf-HC2 domain-containing protein [Deltaproteobacteria bacterium]
MRADDHPSDFALIRYLCQESDPADRDRLRAHLDACEGCRARLAEMETEREAFVATHPWRPVPRAGESRLYSLSRWRWALAAGACAALVLGALFAVFLFRSETDGRDILLKGASVAWVVLRAEEQIPWEEGLAVRAGDRIGISVQSPRRVRAAVASVTEGGRVELLARSPADEGGVLIEAGQRTALPLSIFVRPPAEPQRIFVLLCPADRDPREIADALRSQAAELAAAGRPAFEIESLPGEIEGVFRSPPIALP